MPQDKASLSFISFEMLHSVILCNYNGAPFLAEAIESVLRQTDVSFELIIVDDGSGDTSCEIAHGFQTRHLDTVRVLEHGENRGQGCGFNTGVGASRGELVSFIDSDDVWLPGKLLQVQKAFEAQPEAALYQHNLAFLRDGVMTGEQVVDMMAAGDIAARWRETKCHPNLLPRFAPTTALTLPKHILEHILPCPKMRICADLWLTFGALPLGHVNACFEILGGYRIHDANSYYLKDVPVWDTLGSIVPDLRKLFFKLGVEDPLPLAIYPREKPTISAKVIGRALDFSARKAIYTLQKMWRNMHH